MTGTRLPAVVRRAICSSCRLSGAQLAFRERPRSTINTINTTSALFSTSSRRHAGLKISREPIDAAPEIDFEADVEDDPDSENSTIPMDKLRVVPASPSYFTSKPEFTDRLLELEALLRKHLGLPTLPASQAPRIAWKTAYTLRSETGEHRIKAKQFSRVKVMLQRLNRIHPSIMPEDVVDAINRYKRVVQPSENKRKPRWMDEFGRTIGVGHRKASRAMACLVEGDGQVLINGKTLTQSFDRLRDRESAVWALKATERIGRYNLWAKVMGGGTTGQAEALTLAVGNALMVHEPDLKPALRRAGCITRDPRRVERKKPGRLKARKMPTWVKR